MNLLNNENSIDNSFNLSFFMLTKYLSTLINFQYIKKSTIILLVVFKPSKIVKVKLNSGLYSK